MRCSALRIAAIALALGGCSRTPAITPDGASGTGPEDAAVAAEVAGVVEAVRPNDPVGFDPAVLATADDAAAILPAGSRIEVRPGSTVVSGDEATVDADVVTPGAPNVPTWVFLHRVDGRWLIYGTLPLEQP